MLKAGYNFKVAEHFMASEKSEFVFAWRKICLKFCKKRKTFIFYFFNVMASGGLYSIFILDPSLRILITWYKLHVINYISFLDINQSAKYILELYTRIQIQINQLLIFIKQFSPLPVFEPRTFQVPSRWLTNEPS